MYRYLCLLFLMCSMIVFIWILTVLFVFVARVLLPLGLPSGIIRQHWSDTEKISMAPAQG